MHTSQKEETSTEGEKHAKLLLLFIMTSWELFLCRLTAGEK